MRCCKFVEFWRRKCFQQPKSWKSERNLWVLTNLTSKSGSVRKRKKQLVDSTCFDFTLMNLWVLNKSNIKKWIFEKKWKTTCCSNFFSFYFPKSFYLKKSSPKHDLNPELNWFCIFSTTSSSIAMEVLVHEQFLYLLFQWSLSICDK